MATTFSPPHPIPVFRVLRQAFREYMASSNAAALTVPTPANQAATAATTVAGTLEITPGLPMPATVSVDLKQGAVTKATQAATVNPTTGAFTTTFPANTLAAGTCVAIVTCAMPWKSIQTPPFTVT